MSLLYRIASQHVKLTPLHGHWIGKCPFLEHQGWGACFVIEPRQRRYYCHACKSGGEAISFVMRVKDYDWDEAVDYIVRNHLDPDPKPAA